MDIYGENTIYLSHEGVRLYSYFEYILDIIVTNLSCYSDDFFRNEYGFGVSNFNIHDTKSVKGAIEKIISDRVPESITVNNISIDENKITVALRGSFGLEQASLVIDDESKKSFRVEYIK